MENQNTQDKKGNFLRRLRNRISLQGHVDTKVAADNIRDNQSFRGPNVYILAFAIVIASVGLNVNSIPVIIGAMLISPLMGPIVATGMALGTNDARLLRMALKNLLTMVVISIAASTLYFILSPLKLENPTELLARTNPTIYDVLIALFGGFAGILETSRKEKGTVLSGVAIATALMPPLCTIGYGIASLNMHYALGALYLFFINSVFIALAVFLGVKYLGFESVQEKDAAKSRKNGRIFILAILILIIPSIFSAVQIVQQNNFESSATKFVERAKLLGNNYIYDHKTIFDEKPAIIELFIAADELDASAKETLYQLADEQGINRSQLKFNTDVAGSSLSSNKLAQDLLKRNEAQIIGKDSLIAQLQRELDSYRDAQLPYQQIEKEIKAQFPTVSHVIMARGTTTKGESATDVVMIQILPSNALSETEKTRLQSWASVRLGIKDIMLVE